MKNRYLILILIAVLFTNCESQLDQLNPNKITSDTFFKTEEDFLQALAAAYTPMKNTYGGYFNVRSLELRNYRADDVVVRNDKETLYQIHLFLNSPNNAEVSDMFEEFYSAIYRSNLIIEKIEHSDLSDEFKNMILGEALFIRGINYFFLATEFKDVPLRLKASQAQEDFPIAKSPQSEVYKQVEKDLLKAVELLPVNPRQNGRAGKGAALAYLGKTYIYTEDWNKAVSMLEPLTKTPFQYSLTDDYWHNFDLEHEYNSESIFEITYQKVGAATNRWGEESSSAMMTSPMNRIFAGGDVGGWDICNAAPNIMELFTSELNIDNNYDYRVTSSVAWNYPGCMYFLKPFTESVKPANQNKYYIKKYTYANYYEKEIVPESEINVRAFRYANVLLYLAEAELNIGNKEKSFNYLNQIRKRANLRSLDNAVSVEQLRQDIINQRAIEFFAEGERFYDLRRWGLLENAISNSTAERASNFSMKYAYLPLPSKEIQTNPLINQADGW